MRLTRLLFGNLNKRHWDRRVWEVGYRGPLLAQQKATGRPDYPVSPDRVNILRERLQREMNVMKLLTRPYVTKEVESDHFASLGVVDLDGLRAEEVARLDAARMPGKPKRTHGSKVSIRRRANVGNLLHQHATVEDSLSTLISAKRWL